MDRRFVLSRLRDYVIYITIGVGLVTFTIWAVGSGMDKDEFKWLTTVGGSTPVLGGLIYGSARKVERRSRLFWYLLAGMLVAHAGFLTWVFDSGLDTWSPLSFVYLFPAELLLFLTTHTSLTRWLNRKKLRAEGD
ncbi:MAG TPA: hypothetical protein PLZ95_01080 [Bryobacteraceae bacterium]|nr:hypothetical protein [Bryobacteraceae bacterium]